MFITGFFFSFNINLDLLIEVFLCISVFPGLKAKQVEGTSPVDAVGGVFRLLHCYWSEAP